ncbi:hypothetical protein [Nocardia sp. NPDC051832]|uniref:hypothetical protein n=1 Tax=Nocardia sp. NPDC051832 TaxID=3155673 RepID=UPI0034191E7A
MTTTLTPAAPETLPALVDAVAEAMHAAFVPTQLREEFAILLPRGRWWRKLSLRLADPDGRSPSVFHSREAAENEMFDVTMQARTVFGARRRDYRLRLMVRNVRPGLTTSPWRPADLVADTTKTR